LKGLAWESGKLVARFTTDFNPVGRAHIMNFGAKAMRPAAAPVPGGRQLSRNVQPR